jgi:DNA-directed RNA polymerase sigma subunit (sigma70/sigma32)
MRAVKSFELDKGFRLATYAMWWTRAAIQEYVLRSWPRRLLRISARFAARAWLYSTRRPACEAKRRFENFCLGTSQGGT